MSKYFVPFIIVVFSTSVLASKDGIKPPAEFPETLFEMSEDEQDDAEEELDDDADEELVALSEQLSASNALYFERRTQEQTATPAPVQPIEHLQGDADGDSDFESELNEIHPTMHRALFFVGVIVIGTFCTTFRIF